MSADEENLQKNLDFKGTILKIIKDEEPDLTQEESIMQYNLNKKNKNTNSGDSTDEENSEEAEHLKRIKKELLESLARVKKLEETIGESNSIKSERKRVEIDKSKSITKNIENREKQREDKAKGMEERE